MCTPFSTFAAWITVLTLALALGACGRVNFQPASDASVDIVTSHEDALHNRDEASRDAAGAADASIDTSTLDARPDAIADAGADAATAASGDATANALADAAPDARTFGDAAQPVIAFTSPTGNSIVATGREVILSGTLPRDTGNVSTQTRGAAGSFTTRTIDRDFSDGTFSVGFSLNPVEFEQRVEFRVGADGPFGSIDSRWIEIVYRTPVLVTAPSATALQTRNGMLSVRGTCQTATTRVTAPGGATLLDSDCSDLRWSGEVQTTETEFAVRGMDPDTMVSGEDYFGITFDRTVPRVTATLVAPSGSRNFAVVDVTSSEPGLCVVYLDATCETVAATGGCQPSARVSAWVPENATTTLYSRTYDNAMNASNCQLVGAYTHTAAATPPPCDVMFGSGSAETDASFRAALLAANTSRAAHLADGFVTVCVREGTVITVDDADAPIPLDVDDLYLTTAGATKARFASTSLRGLVAGRAQNVTLDHLAFDGLGALVAVEAGATFRAIRNVDFTSAGENAVSHLRVSGAVGSVESITSEDAITVFDVRPFGLVHSISNSTVTRSSRVLNLGGVIGSITSSRFRSRLAMNGEVIAMYGPAFLGGMTATTWDLNGLSLGATFLSGTSAIEMQGFGIGISSVGPATVRTSRVMNNIVCGVTPETYFTQTVATEPREPLLDGTRTIPSMGAYSDAASVRAFPWGDSSDVANAPWNLQTQWGGPCP